MVVLMVIKGKQILINTLLVVFTVLGLLCSSCGPSLPDSQFMTITTTAESLSTYSNSMYNFVIKYPSGWQLGEEETGIYITIPEFDSEKEAFFSVEVLEIEVNSEESFDEIASVYGCAVCESTKVNYRGYLAYEGLRYESEISWWIGNLLIAGPKYVYQITGRCTSDYLATLNVVFGSFSIAD